MNFTSRSANQLLPSPYPTLILSGREALWERFSNAPDPLGYVPSLVPAWTSPAVPAFGALELEPVAIRLLEGSAMLGGGGLVLNWRAD